MGGFLFLAKNGADDLQSTRRKYSHSIDAMQRKGLTLKGTIERDNFVVFLYNKAAYSNDNVRHFDNGDFILCSGTLFYRNRIGNEALEMLYDEFYGEGALFSHLQGHYCVLLFKGGYLYTFNDLNGLYHVYHDEKPSVISNSFLAVAKSLEKRTVAEQELYEFVSHGAMYGDRTFIAEVKRLDSVHIHQLQPEHSLIPKVIETDPFNENWPFDEQVDFFVDRLQDHFRMLRSHWGDSVGSALTGGYDSRLVVSLLRKVGISPHLYIYGAHGDEDVRVAKAIAEAEGFPIRHFDKPGYPQVSVEEFPNAVEARFHLLDGQGVDGVFDNGTDVLTRRERSGLAALQLNGGGGEIFRNFWKLPDIPMKIGSFLKNRYAGADFSAYRNRFNKRRYLSTLTEKIKHILNTTSETITRRQAEMLYISLRLRYWMGQNNSCNNVLSYALTPLAEPVFSIPSSSIPLRYKNLGLLEAAMIRRIDERLASHKSIYGGDFLHPVPFKYKLKEFTLIRFPIALRPPVIRFAEGWMARTPIPFYLSEEYVGEILDWNSLEISRYMDVEKLRNHGMLNRALTAELVITDRF
ncbi:hypothetical protein ACFL2Q_12715 [Thermodesulfobacteriota bacterium]